MVYVHTIECYPDIERNEALKLVEVYLSQHNTNERKVT